MSLYLGIDGGATKTICVVGDENNVLGTGTSGGCNVVRQGEAQARASLRAAILQACGAAEVDPKQIASTCIGVAGGSVANVRDAVKRIIADIVSGEVIVVGDNEIALEAAFLGRPGVIVASGSGSIAYGRNEKGITARAGGHGFAISDEGSGYWIGRTAITAALRAYDEGSEPQLLLQLAQALGASSRDELVKVANGSTKPDFAALFPVVVRAADAKDLIAVDVLRRAAVELAQLALIVARKLWSKEEEEKIDVAIIGGVFQNSETVRKRFCEELKVVLPNASVIQSVVDPAMGALERARKNLVEPRR